MVVFALFIINKAGGLIFQRDFSEGLSKLSSNEYLMLAGTFHSVHALSTRLSPTSLPPTAPGDRPQPRSGIEVLETENFRLQCFETLTGTKFLLFTDPMQSQQQVDLVIRRIYELYSDYVMKNPFYMIDNPIRCEGWERRLGGWVAECNAK